MTARPSALLDDLDMALLALAPIRDASWPPWPSPPPPQGSQDNWVCRARTSAIT